MKTQPAPVPREIVCPRCWDHVLWPPERTVLVHPDGGGTPAPYDMTALDPSKRADLLQIGYWECPNPSDDLAPHVIPATYGDHDDPVSIGLVGAPQSGKTHLLTAMVREAYAGGLEPFGLRVGALDHRRHERFRRDQIDLLESGQAIDGTARGVSEYAETLLVHHVRTGRSRVVSFFDVAGEDLLSTDVRGRATTRFLTARPSLIFAHAAGEPVGVRDDNESFTLAVGRVTAPDRVPACIVLTKADRLRFVQPIDGWLARPDAPYSAAAVRAESRDVYAHLHSIGAHSSLTPFAAFDRCTLHAVSASGGDSVAGPDGGRVFPRGFRPSRVLQPLVAILAMNGVLDGADATAVGVP